MVRPVTPASAGFRARGALVAVAALVLLAGCSADGEADAGASASPSSSVSAAPSSRPDPDAPLDANQACAAMYVDGGKTLEERIGTALVGASDGLDGTSADQMHAMAMELGRLEPRVPEEFQGPLEKIRVPFLQLQEALDLADGGQVELDIASTVAGLKEYEKLC
ncbi:hypothetical protein [Promicromonospora iranensis]|uniref:Lipoprotein n=1 Tax=Promicromonospora iranensis TaxID=1105144 RepID=A0ABU2CNX0_9MICO|nr:hypothetical protein [Promicromonospora iranensis]MDR7382981.1 hypothetical protein [Promicromonospora iranensis]